MSCWLLVEGTRDMKPLYHAMPIHTAERDFELREGWAALRGLFEKNRVGLIIDPHRECVV